MNIVTKIHKAIPLIVKRISIAAFSIGTVIGGYGLVADDRMFKLIGGYSMLVSSGLPPLFGVKVTTTVTKGKQDEEGNS